MTERGPVWLQRLVPGNPPSNDEMLRADSPIERKTWHNMVP